MDGLHLHLPLLATAGKGLAMVGITPVDACLCRCWLGGSSGAFPLLFKEDDSAAVPPVILYVHAYTYKCNIRGWVGEVI